MQDYFVEITDTFAGEANYSWARHFKVTAQDENDVVAKISDEYGLNWIKQWENGEDSRYDSESGLTCFFISMYDEDRHHYFRVSVIN